MLKDVPSMNRHVTLGSPETTSRANESLMGGWGGTLTSPACSGPNLEHCHSLRGMSGTRVDVQESPGKSRGLLLWVICQTTADKFRSMAVYFMHG